MLIMSAPARAETAWPDTYRARLEALALIETLDADILRSASATMTLEAWCASHAMANPATLTAQLVRGADRPATDEQRRRLGVGLSEPIKHRSVALSCGTHILSFADNWYVPARLTAAMNATLEASDVPFGRVVASLKPTRQTIAATRPWSPLPLDWERQEPAADHPEQMLDIPAVLLEHTAVLYTQDRLPFSEVHEHYTREILAFGHHRLGAPLMP